MAEGESGNAAGPGRGTGFELRLERGGAFVALRPQSLAPGVDLVELAMEVPGVSLPFEVASGAAQFRHRLCDLDRLELSIAEAGLAALVARLHLVDSGIASLELASRTGFAEGAGTLDNGARFTVKVAILPAGDQGIEVVLYEPRVYAPPAGCAAAIPALVARAAGSLARAEGAALFVEPLPAFLRRILPARGWKVPRALAVRLATAESLPGKLQLTWDRAGAAALVPWDPDLLAAVEGARAFAEGERHLAAGDLERAREAYLALGEAASTHPFGASRLLALLTAETAFHDQALELAASTLARKRDFPAALSAVAQVRAARGERALAALALADLAAAAARRGEEWSALEAADACLALGIDADPDAQARAVETALALRRDHLPALRALLALGERADRESLLRACRRLAAYAPAPGEKALAHARLGTLLLSSDPPAARLHLDHALRLGPSDAAALAAVVRACADSGEHLRAVRALDRLRELALARGDPSGAAAVALDIADVWERAGQPENALLRCREACALAEGAQHAAGAANAEERAARLAEGLGQPAEAAAHHEKLLALLEPAVEAEAPRVLRARRALAHHAEHGLGDPARAVDHLQAALLLAPDDADSLRHLEKLLRLLGRASERRDALDRLAALAASPVERARLLAEAARLWEDSHEESRGRWEAVLASLAEDDALLRRGTSPRPTTDETNPTADPASASIPTSSSAPAGQPSQSRDRALGRDKRDQGFTPTELATEALAGVSRAARAMGDPDAEQRALARLTEIAAPGASRAAALDQLAGARERAGDLAGALAAAAGARAEEASPERLETELRLARQAGDTARLPALLADLAAASLERDPSLATRAQLERARLLAATGEWEPALAEACQISRRDPACSEAQELVATLASGRDPALEASALLARAELARRAGESDRAERLALAGHAALAVGRADEGEAFLREALALGAGREDTLGAEATALALGRDEARAGWSALAERAASRGDGAAERAALTELVPLLPTGARPSALLRLSALALADGDPAEARRAAELARKLAPREAAAVEACRVAAEATADAAAIPEILAALAVLEPHRSGALLLDRARRLVALGRGEEADRAMAEALAGHPPDAALAEEHARLRREGTPELRSLPWSEPLETFARRTDDRAAAGRALRQAAELALEQGYCAGALRCARGAFSRTQDDLGFAGPLLADLLYRMGSSAEALVLHRRLFESGLPGVEDATAAAALCRQLSELAEDAGDLVLAVAALDRLTSLQPQDIDAALRRFALDRDRGQAVRALAAAASATRLARLRADGLARAAAAARTELGDPALSDELFAKARADAGDYPAALARVEAKRVEAARAGYDPASSEPPTRLLEALRDLAAARDALGDGAGVAACIEEAASLAARHGLHEEAVRGLLDLEQRAFAAGDGAASARHARAAGLLLLEAGGEAEGAEAVLRRAVARAPRDLECWCALEAAGRARGELGTSTLLEALLARTALDPTDPAPRREAARLLLDLGRQEGGRLHLWSLVRADPGDDASAEMLSAALGPAHVERADLFLLRASVASGATRAALLREASRSLVAAGDQQRARAAAREAFDADPADDGGFVAALRCATDDVDQLDAVLSARAAAVPQDAAGCHRARADALLACGRADAALAAYVECLEHAPADPDVLAHVAEARAGREGDAAAAPHDRRIVALADAEPGTIAPGVEARSRYRLGLAASREGRASAAARHLARAIALAPDADRATASLSALVDALTAQGKDDAAMVAARRLAESASEEPVRREALELGARLAERRGDRGADAAALLERLAALALAREGGDSADALAERAVDALLRTGENARAVALVALAARTAQGQRRAAWLVRLAAAAQARGDHTAARTAREEALVADASDGALRQSHLADLEAAGDVAALARALEHALAAPGADVPALSLRRARALIALGDVAGAERSFSAVVELGTDASGWEEAARGLAAILESRGDLAGVARLELARAEACQEVPARAAALLAASSFLERSGDLAGARVAAEQARDADPDQAGPWLVLSRLSRAAGDIEAAARASLAVAIRSEGPTAAGAALEAAALLTEAGRSDEAERALLAAVAAVPGVPAARRALAERARAAGDVVAAARHLAALDTSALALDEQQAHQRALARALSEAGDPRAESIWQEVFHSEPSDAEAFEHLASPARGRGDSERWLALAARHEGALSGSSDVTRRRDLRCDRAALLTDLGQLDAAEGTWQAALALDPHHLRALRALRALLERRGDHHGAADAVAAEAMATEDPVEAAELLLEEARLRLEKLGDRPRCASALEAVVEKVRGLPAERAAQLLERVERIRAELAPAGVSTSTSSSTSSPSPAPAEPSQSRDPALDRDERGQGSTTPDSMASVPTFAGDPRGPSERSTLSFSYVEDLPRAVPHGAVAESEPLDPALDDDPSPWVDERLRALATSSAGPQQAVYLERLARRLERRGDRGGAADAMLAALEADPARSDRFERALALAGDDRERVVAAHRLRVRCAGTPPDRADALRALGELLAGAPESLPEAVQVLERASALAPTSGATAAALGEALLALGHPSRAMSVLSLFENGAPDLPATEFTRLLEMASESAGSARPDAAANPAPQPFADAVETTVVVPDAPAASTFSGKSAAWAPETSALDAALARAREAPFEGEILAEVASAARALAGEAPAGRAQWARVLARTASGMAAFAADGEAPAGVPPLPLAVSREARAHIEHPVAGSALARLLALLAPYLEALFPADLSRRGVSGQHRVGGRRAPELLALMEGVQRALSTRPFAAFLAETGGCEIVVENTQPPSLVLGAGLLRTAGPAERRFLVARGLALVDLGWALAGKFAPRDVAVLCDLACRFGGAATSSTGLPGERAKPFLEALERLVPPTVRDRAEALAPEAAHGLATLAPRELAAALRQTASRLALLHTGDAYAALAGLLAIDRRLHGLPRAQALAHPDLRDLAAHALSEAHLELRAAAEGEA